MYLWAPFVSHFRSSDTGGVSVNMATPLFTCEISASLCAMTVSAALLSAAASETLLVFFLPLSVFISQKPSFSCMAVGETQA